MKIYMAVTADKFEFPLYIADTATQLAKIIGISRDIIYDSISKNLNGRNTGIKFVKVIIDEEGEIESK